MAIVTSVQNILTTQLVKATQNGSMEKQFENAT